MPSTWPARKDAELVVQAAALAVKIAASPATFSISVPESTALTAASDNFTAAYELAADPATRTASSIVGKDQARAILLRLMRSYAKRIDANLSVSAEQKAELGLPQKDYEPTPRPVPGFAPGMSVMSVTGRTVRMRFFDPANPSRRAKPFGVAGIAVYSFVGENPPADLAAWTYEGALTRNMAEVQFPSSVPNWSKVWLAARYFNPRLQNGPAAMLETNLPGGISAAA